MSITLASPDVDARISSVEAFAFLDAPAFPVELARRTTAFCVACLWEFLYRRGFACRENSQRVFVSLEPTEKTS
jgi:hypothetical protein